MSTPATPTPQPPPLGHPSKKRKYDQLDQPQPPLPPNGSVLYVALYALPHPERRGGVLDYRWAFLLAPDDTPDTHGRQYLIRETSPKVNPGDGPGSSLGLGIMGRGYGELGLEPARRRFNRLNTKTGPQSGAWELEIQDVCMGSSREAQFRVQLAQVQDVESFEAIIKDAFLESDETRGSDWDNVMWMADAWTAVVEAGDVLAGGGLTSQLVAWETVQKTAMEFVRAQENKGRFQDRGLAFRVPTWGLLERRLLVS